MEYGESMVKHTMQFILTFLVYLPILISLLALLTPRKCGRMMTVQDTPELIREKIPSLKKKFGYFNVQLQTYLAENFNPMKPTIIFIHGHGSSFIKLPYKRRSSLRTLIKFRRNISRISPMKTESGRGSWMRFGKPLWKKGYNVFGIDMRNHGGSDIALPFAFGNIEKWDVRTGIEHIRKISSAPIFLHGSSLGTTHSILALGTFQDLPISGLIIESAPAAFNTELFKVWISRVSSCIKYIPKCVFSPIVFWNKLLLFLFSGVCWKNPKNVAKNVQCDVLHLHGKDDLTVPFSAAKSLTKEFEKRSDFYSYKFVPYNGGHMDANENRQFNYLNMIEEFIEKTLNKQANSPKDSIETEFSKKILIKQVHSLKDSIKTELSNKI